MKTKVKDGQTMADIAIQEFGSWEAMIAIAQKNGISMTEPIEPGVVILFAIWLIDDVKKK